MFLFLQHDVWTETNFQPYSRKYVDVLCFASTKQQVLPTVCRVGKPEPRESSNCRLPSPVCLPCSSVDRAGLLKPGTVSKRDETLAGTPSCQRTSGVAAARREYQMLLTQLERSGFWHGIATFGDLCWVVEHAIKRHSGANGTKGLRMPPGRMRPA